MVRISMHHNLTLSEPRWVPKRVDDPAGVGMWDIEVFWSKTPAWFERLIGKKTTSGMMVYIYPSAWRELVSGFGWINSATREELRVYPSFGEPADTYLSGEMLSTHVGKYLREEKVREVVESVIARNEPTVSVRLQESDDGETWRDIGVPDGR